MSSNAAKLAIALLLTADIRGFEGQFYHLSPLVVKDWWSAEISRYYVEVAKLHNEMNKIED